MSASWAQGSTRAWRRTRARVLADNLANNGGRCRLQIKGVCTGLANSVHHTVSRKVVGDDTRYLVAACLACNTHIGEPKETESKPVRLASPPTGRTSSWTLPKT